MRCAALRGLLFVNFRSLRAVANAAKQKSPGYTTDWEEVFLFE